jgi:hypothetical protein
MDCGIVLRYLGLVVGPATRGVLTSVVLAVDFSWSIPQQLEKLKQSVGVS